MDEQRLIKRDISWLSFNHRVLQEAKDEKVPLYERIKFLAIYSSNLDEFFRVRIASLRSFKELKKKTRKQLDVKPKKELKKIQRIVHQQQTEFGQIFRKHILPELREQGVFLIGEKDYSEEQVEFAKAWFSEKIAPHISPEWIKAEGKTPFLKNKGLYFIVQLKDGKKQALVEIPSEDHPRFISLPAKGKGHDITFLDDIIRLNLEDFLQKKIIGAYSIKLSRDADLHIEDEYSGDLVEKIKKSLGKRKIGLPTRLLYDSEMPQELLGRMKDIFTLTKDDLIPGARYHNFNDFFAFPDPVNSTDFHDPPLTPLAHPELEAAPSILDLLKEKDQMLHFPYQKYDYVPRLIWQAADDPSVKTIRITLYRVAAQSEVVQALLHALKMGKEVSVFIEAKARFDEASNLYWGEELAKAKAKVYYSYPGIKVHTKLLLISRKEDGKIRNYAYLGTGNFNEKTAGLYCDHALLTADKRLANEAGQIFDLLVRKIILPKCKHLLISPFSLRRGFEKRIEVEIKNALAGKEAYMILKMNSLEDKAMIGKLYEASRAGVKIRMIIRGICCLVPGLEGQSDNIEVISLVDRFLEHARVYIFANGGEEITYTASADWMGRNLDRRVEVAMPIYDKEIVKKLKEIINLQLKDNCKTRLIDATQSNQYKKRGKEEPVIRAQMEIYRLLQQC